MPESPPPLIWSVRSASEEETRRLGMALGEALVAGDIVALSGTLGAGKTRLVQGICAGLGVTRQLVNSPTFSLIQEYCGRLGVYHFDTYRLRSVDEFLELGALEYFDAGGICLIEWADRVAQVLPDDRLDVSISIVGELERKFQVVSRGPRSAQTLANAQARLGSFPDQDHSPPSLSSEERG